MDQHSISTISAFFEMQASQRPSHVAAIFKDQFLSYKTLNEQANQLARYLIEQGVKPNTPVAFCISRKFSVLIATLAILKMGCAFLPLDPKHPIERLLYQLEDNANPMLLLSNEEQHLFQSYNGPQLFLDNLPLENIEASNLSPVNPSDLAYIIYTSGTTGRPKGVLVEHQTVVNYCHWFAEYACVQIESRVDFSSSLIFDMSLTTSLVSLMLGLTVVIAEENIKEDLQQYLRYINEQYIDIIKITPSFLHALLYELHHHLIPLPHLKTVILGGENLDRADCQLWLNFYPHHTIYNEYGPTEATIGVTQCLVNASNLSTFENTIPIGRPAKHVQCYLLDENLHLVDDGKTGMLYIGGECLARGYLNQPELTEKRFIASPFGPGKLYQTGDLCYTLADGSLVYVGRLDAQQKIRGFRIEPSEIEAALCQYPNIQKTVVLALEKGTEEKQLVAYYQLKKDNVALSYQELHDHLKHILPEYMIPNMFIQVSTFPLTLNGKLDSKALAKISPEYAHDGEIATTELTQALTDIWQNELHINNIKIEENFFELGGHSLSASRILSQIQKQFRKKIELSDFYQAPTINQLASLIEKASIIEAVEPSIINLLRNKKALPLCDFQLTIWFANRFEPKVKKINIVGRKRLMGMLNIHYLTRALQAVLQSHTALQFRPSKIRPLLYQSKTKPFEIQHQSLKLLSESEQTSFLENSISELTYSSNWKVYSPMLMVKVFDLNDHESELQLCLPHIVCDEVSIDILFADLSHYYQIVAHHAELPELKPTEHLQNYLFNEQEELAKQAPSKIAFWQHYLASTSLFEPPEAVCIAEKNATFHYSTYEKLSHFDLKKLYRYCAVYQINITEILCAVFVQALLSSSQNKSDHLFINLVKSKRNDRTYDNTIGCFLRLETISVILPKELTIFNIAKAIQFATLETVPYQGCSFLVKASFLSLFKNVSKIQHLLFRWISQGYRFVLGLPKYFEMILQHSLKLSGRNKNKTFIITFNIHNNFLKQSESNVTSLFGFNQKKMPCSERDLIQVDGVLDVCFHRDDSNELYLIISANLLPAFREKLAQSCHEIIRQLAEKSDTLTSQYGVFDR